MLISLSKVLSRQVDKPLKSVTHGHVRRQTYNSWRDISFGKHEHGAQWLLICVSDADVLLTYCLRHVTGWRGEERTLSRGVAERCRDGKEKLKRWWSLCNKRQSCNVDCGFCRIKRKATTMRRHRKTLTYLLTSLPAAKHHRPLTGTKLYCLVTEAHACEWTTCPRLLPESGTAEARTRDLLSHESSVLTTTPSGHSGLL